MKITFLGAAEGVAVRAAERLKKKYRGLVISGVYSPPWVFETDPEELNRIACAVREAAPHILALGLGTPKQEKYFYENRDMLQVPVALHIGGTIDFEAGNIKRAPTWISHMGFEWLYRLIKEPARMWRRYLVDDMAIFKIFWKYRK